MNPTRPLALAVALLVAGGTIAACGSDASSDGAASNGGGEAVTTTSPGGEDAALSIRDAWVKSAAVATTGGEDMSSTTAMTGDDATSTTAAMSGSDTAMMSAAFGVLVNDGDEDVVVVSAASDVSSKVELHETVESASGEMTMRQKEGGFVVPAHGELELQPGGNHLMFMALDKPILAGDEVKVTLTLDDGSTLEFTAVAKDYSGANEDYAEPEG